MAAIRSGALAGAVMILLVAAGCARRSDPGSAGRESSSRGGAAVPAAPPPQRIISCAPNLTEMIFALGAGDRLVGVTRFCRYPPEAQKIPPLGDLYAPNLEAMVAARPDLIVLVPGNRKVQEFFAAHPGPRVLETNACETIVDIRKTVLQLGAEVGEPGRAVAITRRIQTGLDSLRRAYAGAPRVRYLMVLGHDQGALNQIYVVGRNTYLTELTELAGGVNIVDSTLGRYPIVSREAVIRMNPDLIIERYLGDRPATPAEKQALVDLWKQMPALEAVRRGRVVVMDDNHITINGIDLVASGRKLARLLHPEMP